VVAGWMEAVVVWARAGAVVGLRVGWHAGRYARVCGGGDICIGALPTRRCAKGARGGAAGGRGVGSARGNVEAARHRTSSKAQPRA
jgi:hypothetical protein